MGKFIIIVGVVFFAIAAFSIHSFKESMESQCNGETFVTVKKLQEKGYQSLALVSSADLVLVKLFLDSEEGKAAMQASLHYLKTKEGKKEALKLFQDFGVPEHCYFAELLG